MAQTEHFDLKPDGGIPQGYTSSDEYQAGYEARLREKPSTTRLLCGGVQGGLMRIESLDQVRRSRI